jgi:hypothetical protein
MFGRPLIDSIDMLCNFLLLPSSHPIYLLREPLLKYTPKFEYTHPNSKPPHVPYNTSPIPQDPHRSTYHPNPTQITDDSQNPLPHHLYHHLYQTSRDTMPAGSLPINPPIVRPLLLRDISHGIRTINDPQITCAIGYLSQLCPAVMLI